MVKQQHYVPRCYLRNFSNSKEQIWAYDKSSDKVFLAGIQGVASEKCFYDADSIDQAAGQEQFVEKVLSKLEGQAATIFRDLFGKLEGGRFTKLSSNERYFLAFFMAIQMLRTREHRHQIEQMFNQVSTWVHSHLTEEMKTASADHIPPTNISENQLAEMQGMFLLNPDNLTKYAEILESHFWIILRAVPSLHFITSDHPVCRKANVHRPFRSMSGIASTGIEIVFPLSPKYCLCLYERSFFRSQLEHIKASEDGVFELSDEANMDYCNYFQIRQSSRFLFSSSNNDLRFAKAVCAEEPQWRNAGRKRVVSNHEQEET